MKGIRRCLAIIIALLTAACTASCSVRQADQPVSSAETEPAAVTATPEPTAEATLAPETIAATESVTEAPTEYEFRWVRSDAGDAYDATGFVSVSDVIPDAVMDIRYYSDHNFVGERIDGYEEPVALLSEEAAYALKGAADELRDEGYRLIIYDAYRPQRAVNHFSSWASDWSDTKMKDEFYPSVDKSLLFDYGYIAYYSGHSRGSKVDLSLIDASTGEAIEMGGGFDYFDTLSHPDYT